MNMKKLLERLLEKLLSKPLEKLARKVEQWEREADAARKAEQAQESAQEAAESRGEDGGGNDSAEGGGAVPGAAANDGQMTGKEEKAAQAEDAADFSALDWCWGGFKGGGAALDNRARIMGLRVTSSGLSYSWMSGGCENLGASGKDDAACIAALFCLIGGKWRGGKFDWISTSRTTRAFTNIAEGYGGWDNGAVGKADKFAFVICAKDGKRRTNVVLFAK